MTLLASKWNFHERIEKGKGVVTSWIERSRMNVKTQARFDRNLDQLRQQPKANWSKPMPASSLGNHTYVIRFTDTTNAQLRVFGHFFDGHSAFVMTFYGGEKDNAYYPNDYEEVVQRHKQQCDQNFSGTTIKYQHYCPLCDSKSVAQLKSK